MHTPIVLLSLGLAVAVATGALADHGELITSRNLGVERAERAAAAVGRSCGGPGCGTELRNTTRLDGTVLAGCVRQAERGSVLQVDTRVPWTPRVFTGLTPARGMVAVDLGGFSVPAIAVLHPC